MQEDVVYDLPAGRVIVRLDGWESHSDKLTALVDRRRTVAAALSSSTPIPYGWTEVTKLPCRTAREVEAVLRMIGWTDPSTSCPRCA
ncbi:hypothetical protein Acsp06_51720 [Actinomycetospora sp. NBRC 106375]|uniref:hypothetical protein n=1 Tax=Actinomycetospora sp. NBRC 106375 TaxID=3032207 RepID=UPI0024A2731D|nr:hypothetical protein [Actinomycetospora sp. NBRC 106375]GLZ48987.1 hypothetical protein Acsp06_51720 [Actinomycetospora sp. NBRC 106375]